MLAEDPPSGANVPPQANTASDARVERLTLDVARAEGALTEIMEMMRNAPMFNTQQPNPPQHPSPPQTTGGQPQFQPRMCYQPHEAPHLCFDHPQQHSHPPPPHGPAGYYRAPGAPEFNHLARMEPMKIPDLWFSGEPSHLLTFLRAICDFLQPRASLFQSESRRIVWILRHFGYQPSDHRKNASPAENWYTLLVNDNVRRQGNFSPYADLDGIEFTIPVLLSVEAFIKGLILVFGDWFMKENTKRALAACKQRDSTIGEYNSRFCSLVYLVEDVEAARIERYVSGLNPRIIHKAMSKKWRAADTLKARMELATEAAAQLNLLALLPPDLANHACHRPLSSAPPPGFSQPPQHQSSTPVHDPNAMEINATMTRPGSHLSLLYDQSRSICRNKKLCFRCLKPVIPITHTGSLNCLNLPVSVKQRKLFIKRNQQNPTAEVSAISLATQQPAAAPPLTYQPELDLIADDDPSLAAEQVMGNYQNFDKEYDDYKEPSCLAVNVPVNTVQV
ncbi:hypothetical protein PCASD_21478 [Puccinia coronata f. sp. avenae]|uniref:Retrotransposon gag domain-containing protein n=1 Tax=Puccinia coronata f. sp. avenae TaxID=200324 RepID=A0A2N5S9K2_9BASI|nr:hypothetical protein PCASD_21478 [Puccinia coronata f. sp. avenae]